MEQMISINLLLEGEVLGNSALIVVGRQNNELLFGSRLRLEQNSGSELLKIANCQVSEQVEGVFSLLMPQKLSCEFCMVYHKELLMISSEDKGILCKVAKYGSCVALLFSFNVNEMQESSSMITQILSRIAYFFHIEKFFFYMQNGNEWLLPRMLTDNQNNIEMLEKYNGYDFMCYTHLQFSDSDFIGNAMRTLFRVTEIEAVVVAKLQKNITEVKGILNLPEISTPIIKSQNLYLEIGMTAGKTSQLSFLLAGDFEFPFVRNMVFHVECGLDSGAFEFEAYAITKSPVALVGPLAIGDTCISVRVSAGVTIGMYTTLYIGEIQCAGAIMVLVSSGVPVLQLASAAISDISIPVLVRNVVGKEIVGIEVLDFIQIKGLPFSDNIQYGQAELERAETNEIVEIFNRGVHNSLFNLESSQVKITPFATGIDITDLKRMRHYYINSTGQLQLTAQFYYAALKTRFGGYTVEPGVFVCGVIEIFGKEFEVLFVSNQNDGIMAYAKIPTMNLGFIKIESSSYKQGQQDGVVLSSDNALTQFIDLNKEGIVFFLSAYEKEVSFYLDGKVTLLGIYTIDSRIIFCEGLISVDFQLDYLQLFKLSVHIKVSYNNFLKGAFAFSIMLETSGLAEKMSAVTQKIDAAIQRVRNKIASAKKEITAAENHVNGLYEEIDHYNQKIKQCKNQISKTKRWKRGWVAFVKGIEIGCYEVAISGIHVAIGLAKAALQVARGVLSISGMVSETVMKAVNGLIQGALSLFYIQQIELNTSASLNEQNFSASISFVALGKQYNVKKTIGRSTFSKSPIDTLSGTISNEMNSDLEHIEDGSYRSNWRKYKGNTYTIEENGEQLVQSKVQLESSINLMEEMQKSYLEEFEVPLEESEEMNISILQALDSVNNIMETGLQVGNIKGISSAMGGLKRSFNAKKKKGVFRDSELIQMQKVIDSYDEAKRLYNQTDSMIHTIKKYRSRIDALNQKAEEARTSNPERVIFQEPIGDLCKVIDKVETKMYQEFPVDKPDGDYINLSREAEIIHILEEADKEMGREPSQVIRNARSRSKKGRYSNRL